MRQEAVREMGGAYDFRDRLEAEGRMMEGGGAGEVDRFLEWAEGGAWLESRSWVRAVGILLPAVNLTAIVLYFLGLVPLPVLVWPLVVSTLLYTQLRKGLNPHFDKADDGESGVRRFAPLSRPLGGHPSPIGIRGGNPPSIGSVLGRRPASGAHPRPPPPARGSQPRHTTGHHDHPPPRPSRDHHPAPPPRPCRRQTVTPLPPPPRHRPALGCTRPDRARALEARSGPASATGSTRPARPRPWPRWQHSPPITPTGSSR